MNACRSSCILLGRALLSAIFLYAGYTHASDWGAWVDNVSKMTAFGNPLPYPEVMAGTAIGLALVGGVMMLFGIFTRVGAFFLLLYLIAATVIGHAFWEAEGQEAQVTQLTQFLKNLGLAGGLILVMASGGGCYCLVRRRRDGVVVEEHREVRERHKM
jgi:putative oxidoreductase